tara:strand:+ start:105 stop:311 length:207 start_codon:yes stop_codon:yes gene_type:complete
LDGRFFTEGSGTPVHTSHCDKVSSKREDHSFDVSFVLAGLRLFWPKSLGLVKANINTKIIVDVIFGTG